MRKLLPVLMVFGMFLGLISGESHAARELFKCNSPAGIVWADSLNNCINHFGGTKLLPASYGDFDGVWAGTIQCKDPDLSFRPIAEPL